MRQSELHRRKLHRRQRRIVLLGACAVGLASGGLAVFFQSAVAISEGASLRVALVSDSMGLAGWIWLAVLGAVLGACAGWVTEKFCPEAGGSGIPDVKAVLMNLRQLRPFVLIPTKMVGGILALAAGMSLGREGPTIQIGAAVGKIVAKLGKLPRRSLPILIAAGAGAGLGAAFNAPLAGFLFVMEELKREMSPLTYGAALIASVSAVAVERFALGQASSFALHNPTPVALRALPLVLLLGVTSGFLGVGFNKLTISLIEFRERIKVSRWLAGAVVGVVAAMFLRLLPEVTGGGHSLTHSLLTGSLDLKLSLGFVSLLLVTKLFLTSSSFATGVPGGIFAPILAMGALEGYLFGAIVHVVFPGLEISPHVFATIGMASMLSASVRAPLTGVVLIVEMTQEYSLLYALLLGAFISYVLADLMKDKPIYEALLEHSLHRSGELGTLPEETVPVDLVVEPDSFMDGRFVRHLNLPKGTLIVSIEREGGLIIPHGDTRIRYGDHVEVLVSGEYGEEALLALHDAAKAP